MIADDRPDLRLGAGQPAGRSGDVPVGGLSSRVQREELGHALAGRRGREEHSGPLGSRSVRGP